MTWIPDTNELAPGVTIERRAIFWAPLDWDDFIRLCPADAAEFARDASETGQDAYLHRIAAWAVRLKSAPDTKLGAFPGLDPKVEFGPSFRGVPFAVIQWRMARLGAFAGLDPKVEFGPSFRGVPFAVIQWRMAPHAILPAHCHPQFSVCTVGIEGEARLRHFEVYGPAPAFDSGARTPFLIRE